MSNPLITYTPRNDTSAEVEAAALASIYAYIVNIRQDKDRAAGRNGSDNEDVRDISRESSRLPDGERRLVLGIVRQFRDRENAVPAKPG
jgi:hypothetical protein